MTSHDCVWKLRKLFGTKRVGHTGTLDPEVDGVLPICIGHATRIVEELIAQPKTYEGEVTLGYATTTEDATGAIVERTPLTKLPPLEEIDFALLSLTGTISQTPPMYSAVKVNGKKLYEYARAGQVVERPTRHVHIYKFERLDSPELNDEQVTFSFRVRCSKGTYVRTLAVAIGEALGVPAHMSQLTRTEAAGFTADECVTLQSLTDIDMEERIKWLRPIEDGLLHLPKWVISDTLTSSVENGAKLHKVDVATDWPVGAREVVAETKQGKAIAIYQEHPTKTDFVKPKKVFVRDE